MSEVVVHAAEKRKNTHSDNNLGTALISAGGDPLDRIMKTNIKTNWKTSLKSITFAMFTALAITTDASAQAPTLTVMPDEAAPHEGTWLQWPHHYTYGTGYRNALDSTWVAMTKSLIVGERVHIIAYNTTEKARITALLKKALVPLANVTFLICKTDDVWVRDNGPVFVKDASNRLFVTDWGFNGWGFDTAFRNDNTVPASVATALHLPRIDINEVILENGAVALDGQGVLMATRSSILEPDRNPDLTQAEVELEMKEVLGAKKIIWLDGAPGGQDDITDTHIDGFVSFAPNRKLVTISNADLTYWGISAEDINAINAATDVNGVRYTKVTLPLTARNVSTTSGRSVGFKGSYVNYYVANTVVLMPAYNDPNDAVAKNLLQQQYPGRTVVAIDVRNLYANGGMVHCVTQQQPR